MLFLSKIFYFVPPKQAIFIFLVLGFIFPAAAAHLQLTPSQVNLNTMPRSFLALLKNPPFAAQPKLIQLALNDANTAINAVDGGLVSTAGIPIIDASNVTLRVRKIFRTMNDGAKLMFWVFCTNNTSTGSASGCTLPSPLLELQVGQQANVVLDIKMAPQEPYPYQGHTIHHHGLDVNQAEDGVPDTGAAVNGDTYNFAVDSRYVGSHMYHCHVHTVKHLEMGMYGAFIVKDGNRINANGPTYDYEWNVVMSTVDPRYHSKRAILDSKIFADYIPKYFLLNGNEGLSAASPAEIFTATPGATVAIRLIGIHSTNSVFRIKNSTGKLEAFVLHNSDGFKLAKPKSVTRIEQPFQGVY